VAAVSYKRALHFAGFAKMKYGTMTEHRLESCEGHLLWSLFKVFFYLLYT